ncbi:MAG: EAL domain-containing protein [Proteobacteria bacterium]|nr:EAL domain-containing protein [Pseudomonadota bacterium]
MSTLIWQILSGILLILLGVCLFLANRLKKALSLSLKREESAYTEMLDFPTANPNPVMRVNKLGKLAYANPASAGILTKWQIDLNEKLPSEWREIIRQVILSGKTQSIEFPCQEKFYYLNVVPLGQDAASIFGMDITQRKMLEKELEHRSTTDQLTNLPNRFIFLQNVTLEINHAKSSKVKLGVFIVRLDDYVDVINTYNQSIADQLVQLFCLRLVDFIAGKATVARLQDNMFGVIDPELKEASTMAAYVQALMEKCAQPFKIEEYEIFITLSVGISYYPSDGENAEVLIRNALLAVNRTSSTRNEYEFFQRGMIDQLQIKRNIISDLHKAIENKQFTLYYQPQIHLQSRKLVGCEALIRWQHPQKGFISPFFFMTAAEETQLINPIGEWVLREACKQVVKWQKEGKPRIQVAVNVSASQLFQGDIVGVVRNVMQETGIIPQMLSLELTESALVQDMNRAIEIMKDFRALGLELALDDFGTGYSSLSYLMQFPVSKIKIDRSFVKIIEDEKEENYAVTKGIIELGHSLNLKVIAEGVESKLQLNYLKKHNCDIIQGFYFGQPQPADKFSEFFNTDWKA